jgi:hypothetical protein
MGKKKQKKQGKENSSLLLRKENIFVWKCMPTLP